MASTGRSAFSQNGEYYAFCGNDSKLKIWETASGRLKHEYTPNWHLSSPCSVIGWISVSPQSPSNVSVNAPCTFQPPQKLLFPPFSLSLYLHIYRIQFGIDNFQSLFVTYCLSPPLCVCACARAGEKEREREREICFL